MSKLFQESLFLQIYDVMHYTVIVMVMMNDMSKEENMSSEVHRGRVLTILTCIFVLGVITELSMIISIRSLIHSQDKDRFGKYSENSITVV